MKKAALHNLGCKVNAYETEMMEQMLREEGYEIVPFAPGADVYVINTCSVTNIADRKSRQMLHRARKMNPDAIVVAAGCYVQTAGEDTGADDAIDIILGNNKKNELIPALRAFMEDRGSMDDGPFTNLADLSNCRTYEDMQLQQTHEHTRAYMKVQDGCNQFCSYCIIPYARGRVRSRRMEDVLTEARQLSENGCRELVLTGIHLSSYGTDTGSSLLELIRAVHEVPGIERIRLGSLEPGIISEEFAQELKQLPKFCPHFHLSLQSGCDTVLKRMNRHYTAAQYAQACALLRDVFTDPALTTDVIVGFPGETEEEFRQTVRFLEDLKLYETHIFKYSRRKGTRAAVIPDQISEQVKAESSDVLIGLGLKNRDLFEHRWQGRQVQALMEECTNLDGKAYYTGYTKEYIRTAIPAEGQPDLTNVLVTGFLSEELKEHVWLLKTE